ncbi:hypothetical protein MASR2M18_17350 [Ignavibacteria bacterium]|nr:hypothetical protein [Bacteroidota bacterium]MCZ2132008.1 hypothetical protein [Bacteroidota bacterium]
MEKDNFLNQIKHIAEADREALRAELGRASAISVIGDTGPAKPLGKAAPDGTAATENHITPEEFEQGVFLKIMLKSLSEAEAPPDFAEKVMNRVAPPQTAAPKVWKKIAAAIVISGLAAGGTIVAIHSGESTKAPMRQEVMRTKNTEILPEIKSVILEPPSATGNAPAMKRIDAKAIKKQNSIEYRIPQKGDSTIIPTEGPTPED